MFQKILLPVDGSEHSQRAAKLAGQLAGESGGEVVVVHVVEREVAKFGAVVETTDEALQLVEDAVRGLEAEGVKARGEARGAVIGQAAHGILDAAKGESPDLIVMGTRGLGGLAGLVLGSVTTKVLHGATCPVLVVR